MQHRVVISEKDDGRPRRFTPAGQPLKNLAQRRARPQRPLGSALDHRPIGQGIGKRHAQLNHVRAATVHRGDEAARGLERRVTGRQVRDVVREGARGLERAPVAIDAR